MARPKMLQGENLEKDNKIESLENQVLELTKLVQQLLVNNKIENQQVVDKQIEDIDDEDQVKVSSDEYIKVMSLTPHPLNLSRVRGDKRPFSFDHYGQVKRILYKDLVEIMENHPNFLNDGNFIILNRAVIRRHGLDDAYEKLLTKEKIDSILQGNQSDAVNMFKSTNPKQQTFIVEIIVRDMVEGKPVDLNFIDRLSRVIGYNIQEKAEDAKKLKLILENKEVS